MQRKEANKINSVHTCMQLESVYCDYTIIMLNNYADFRLDSNNTQCAAIAPCKAIDHAPTEVGGAT